jgi:hypothetical protein
MPNTLIWTGNGIPRAKVATYTIGGTIEVGDVFILTSGIKQFTYTAGTTVAATEAAAMVTALQALTSNSGYNEFTRVTAAYTSGGSFTLTSNYDGEDFTITPSTTESGGGGADAQTFAVSTTTTNTGPAVFDDPNNWNLGVAPATGDTVIFENSSKDCLYGLSQSGVTLAALYVRPTYTGAIGLAKYNTDGGFAEYRPLYLNIKATLADIDGSGSSRLRFDFDSAANTTIIRGAGNSREQGVPTILWKGTNAGNVLTVLKGTVGVAIYGGETANLTGGLKLGYITNLDGDADVKLGSGVTLAQIDKEGGKLEINSNVTTLNHNGGETTINNGGVTMLTGRVGGKVIYNSTGTLATASLSGAVELDFSRDPRAKAVTNPIDTYGSQIRIRDPFKVVNSGAMVIDCNETGDLSRLDIGQNVRITRGTPS